MDRALPGRYIDRFRTRPQQNPELRARVCLNPSRQARHQVRTRTRVVALRRKPLAPARSAWYTYSSRSKVVSIRTRDGAWSRRVICRVASMPFRFGILISMSTTSGRTACADRRVCRRRIRRSLHRRHPQRTLTLDGQPFQNTGDYWYTGIGMIPAMAAPLVLVRALHSVQHGRDGRRGRAGATVMSAGLAVFVAMGILGLIIGQATSLGPTYLIATAATIIGIALFAAGSGHNGLLPRWLLAAWVAAWLVAGPLARGATPLLLAGVYILIGLLLAPPSHDTTAQTATAS